jgi:hypothetical protein
MSLKPIFLFIILNLFAPNTRAQVQVVNLRCEYKINPLGLETQTPHLGWEIKSATPNFTQVACRVWVADNETLLNQGKTNIWDSGKILTRESVQFDYKGPKLQPNHYYYWKVAVWDQAGHSYTATKAAKWQMGLLQAADWQNAKWIGYEALPAADRVVPAIHQAGPKNMPGTGKDVLPLLRKEFTVKNNLKCATVYLTGLGQFDACLNGKKIGNDFLDPGWTNYDKEALYVPFDVTSLLSRGKNTIGIMLGNGMYYIPRERYRKFTGAFGYPKMKCLLVLQYQDGHVENIVSDENWKAAPGPITFSSIYGGEDFDARLVQAGWNTSNFDDHKWRPAISTMDTAQLHSQKADPVMVMDSFLTKKITHPKPNVWVYDMGQNSSGIPQLTVKGVSGAAVKITPGELLAEDGTVSQKGIGSPNYFTYTLSGNGVEIWHPQFSYYGFRYLQVEGASPAIENNGDLPVIIKMQSLHIRNSAGVVGHFYCSNELFNRTFNLINWSIKSNMVSIFTDCPTREKLGWLEQDHLMANSIRYNYDAVTLFKQTINVMKAAQLDNGLIPNIAPEYVPFEPMFRDSPEWGSTGVLLPWYIYQWYGDKTVLAESFEMIKRYVGYLSSKSKDGIVAYGLGDWFDIGPKALGRSQLTPLAVTGTAYYYYDTKILADIAKLLGKQADAEKYSLQASAIKQVYNDHFFNKETKNYSTGSQAANAISVYMGLVAPENKKAVVDNIVADIRKNNNAITAGDIGFRYLLKVLADEEHSDVVFDLNNRSDVPGYGYQLAKGATALTESWQALPTVSNDHLMLGHLMEWFYNDLAGIQYPDASGVGHFTIKPQPVGDVTAAKADYQSPYGTIKSDWQVKNHVFTLTVTIPANTSAKIYLPKAFSKNIRDDGKLVSSPGQMMVTKGSGVYHFSATSN